MVFLPTAKQVTEDDLKLMLQISHRQEALVIPSPIRVAFSGNFCVIVGDTFIMIGGDTMEELKAFVIDKKFIVGLVAGFVLGALHHYFAL